MQVNLAQNERAVLGAMYTLAFGGSWKGEGTSSEGLKLIMDRLRRSPCLYIVVIYSGLDLESAADGIQTLQIRAMVEPVRGDHMNMVKQLARHAVVSPEGHRLSIGPLEEKWMIFWNDEPLRELTAAAWSKFELSFIRKVRLTPLGVQFAEAIHTSLNRNQVPVRVDARVNESNPLGANVRDQAGSPTSFQKKWLPPKGYVGRKTVCSDMRFQKNGKNPPATTIDGWVQSAARQLQSIDIQKDPASGENYYLETWIQDRIVTWNPR